MTENQLKDYKKIYSDIIVPESTTEKNWRMQRDLFPEQDIPGNSYHFMSYGAVFLSTFVVLFIVIGVFIYASKPGSLLYPVNTFTQQLTKKVTGTLQKEDQTFTPPKTHSSINVLKQVPTPTAKPTETPAPKSVEEENHSDFQNVKTGIAPNTKVLGTQTDTNNPPTQAASHGDSDNSSSSNASQHSKNDNGSNGNNSHANNGNSNNSHGNGKK